MYKGFDPHKPYFHSVALAFIVIGAAIVAFSMVEWLMNVLADYRFFAPSMKMICGVVVTALGYVVLELELIRISRKHE